MYTGLGLDSPTFADFFYEDGTRRLMTVAMLASMDAAERARYTDYTTTELARLMQSNPDLIVTAEEGLFKSVHPLNEMLATAPLEIWQDLEPYENVITTEGGGRIYSGSMVEQPAEGEVVNVGQRYIPPIAPGAPPGDVIIPSGGAPVSELPPAGGVISPTPSGGGGGGFPSWGILAIVGLGAYILGRK